VARVVKQTSSSLYVMMTPDCAAEFTAALFVMRCNSKNNVQEQEESCKLRSC